MTSADDLKVDWKKGTVTENFRGLEPVFDGHKISMFASVRGRGHNFYEVPILLKARRFNNHKLTRCNLQIRYDTSTDKYSIIGIGNDIENGMVRGLGYELTPGDVITPIFKAIIPAGSSNTIAPTEYVDPETGKKKSAVITFTDPKTHQSITIGETYGEPFVYTRDSAITNKKISNGDYLYLFQFVAPNGTAVSSSPAAITIKYGEILRFDSEDVADTDNQ